MDVPRRQLLRIVGGSVVCVGLTGCLSATAPRSDTDDGTTGTDDGEFQRVDEPPHDITEPECDPPDDGRDPLWLCDNVAAEPTLPFEQVETSGPVLRNEGLRLDDEHGGRQFYTTLLTDTEDVDRIDRSRDSSAAALIEGTDFGSDAILVAQTGWGSGSVTPHLERIEATGDGIHAFGCYRRPCVWTDDYTNRTVVARFERPDALDTGVVSLTVDARTRIHFRVDEGVVTVE